MKPGKGSGSNMGGDHISDREMLLDLDGELPGARATEIGEHLAGCRSCRERRAEIERGSAGFAAYYQALDLPPIDGPRALLRARLSEATADVPAPPRWWEPFAIRGSLAWAGGALLLLAVTAGPVLYRSLHGTNPFAPNAALTPGSTRSVSRETVCEAGGRPEFHGVPASVARTVFTHYGIRNPRPRSYEVDYLIPPSLGGTEEPSNLWPQPYSAGVWTAPVKDALEDRLRALVCEGKLDLATAQQDLARDWIGAYKKYFRTDRPLVDHAAFVKDQPWE